MTCQKTPYGTHAQAQAALDRIVQEHKRTGKGGKSWKRLNVYRCKNCSMWHLGRANSYSAAKPQPGPKLLTAGQLRRAERKAAEKAAHQALYADYADTLRICKILADRNMALYEALGVKPLPFTKPEARV